ncbi:MULTISPECIES: hypothetical protein [Microbacterium]|uniref:hypothetical protein n=1 Tax=Microbacterium TaxID=33882 RepID=UPI0022F13735|nr:hypothetical protein [Streptomyces sp. MS2A]
MTTTAQDLRRPRWLFYTLLGIAGLFYAYAVWNAIAYLVTVAGLGIDATSWAALVIAILLPVLVFVVSILITRRRGLGVLAIVLLAGLGVVAVFWVDVVGYTVKALSGGGA